MKNIDLDPEAMKRLAGHLRQVNFLSHLNMAEIGRIITYVQLFQFHAGEVIFKQGGRGDAFYIIDQGEVAVRVKKIFFLPSQQVNILKTGHFFGETALIDRAPRTATVKALTPTTLFVFHVESFDLLFKNNPSFAEIVDTISKQRKLHT